MREQPRRQQSARAASLVLNGSLFAVAAAYAIAGEINSCKYLVIADFTSDPYGVAKELRAQAAARGFKVALKPGDIPAGENMKTCLMSGSWTASGFGGRVEMRVVDAGSAFIGEAAAAGTNWVNAQRTLRNIVEKIYKQLGYTGFDEAVFQQRLFREYPKRPTVTTTEETIKKMEPRNRVEGIWTDGEDRYRMGIVPAPEGTGADYFAVILRSNSPLWQPGEIKAEIRRTASPAIFTSTYFLQNKRSVGTTFTLEDNSVLRSSSISTPAGTQTIVLVRVWPTTTNSETTVSPPSAVATGTGFLLSHNGLIATNWHVVADAKNITVTFPGWRESVPAEIALRDKVNDLALLRVEPAKLAATCTEFPFELASSSSISLGQRVSTVGFPLTSMLGSSPRFAEGVISSKSGWQDDPRTFQISAQVQPGSSGSPLFDGDGRVIGIVVSTLDAGKVYQAVSALPQNVNFAVKSDYLLNLLAMLPAESATRRTEPFSPERAAKCVAVIRAW